MKYTRIIDIIKCEHLYKSRRLVNLLVWSIQLCVNTITRGKTSGTGLLGSWRRFTFHLKGFFSSELDGGEYHLISGECCYSHMCHWPPLTNMHFVRVIITSELSTCLKGWALVTGYKVWRIVKLPGEEWQWCIVGPGKVIPETTSSVSRCFFPV